MLETVDLDVTFPIKPAGKIVGLKAVNDVSLHLEKGDSLGLVGESGSGKSTIGRAVLGLTQSTGGKIIFQGRDITHLTRASERDLRKKAQMIFQDPHSSLNPRMTIYRSVSEPLILHTDMRGVALRGRVEELLEIVGLQHQFLYRYPHELSGGQKQRVCIARAIALNPELLVLDEPTSALDVSVQAQALEFLKEIQARMGLTYLFISHNLAVVRFMCNKTAVLYLGKVVEQGLTEDIFDNPLHPYTKALIEAVPLPRSGQPRRTEPLKGEIASPIDLPTGCAFHVRCPKAIAGRCDVDPVPLYPAGEGRAVRCFLHAPD